MGYVKLDRTIAEHWLWEDKPFTKGQAWVDLILLAQWRDNKGLSGGKIETYERGKVYTSQVKLAERWGWSRDRVIRFLALIEADGMCTCNKTAFGTVISIENYEFYQGGATADKTALKTPNKTTDKTPNKTAHKTQKKKKEEVIRNNNKYNTRAREDDPAVVIGQAPMELRPHLTDYLEMRNTIKAPMTGEAMRRLLAKLERLSGGDLSKCIELLDEAIINNWKSVYLPREQKQKQNPFLKLLEEEQRRSYEQS